MALQYLVWCLWSSLNWLNASVVREPVELPQLYGQSKQNACWQNLWRITRILSYQRVHYHCIILKCVIDEMSILIHRALNMRLVDSIDSTCNFQLFAFIWQWYSVTIRLCTQVISFILEGLRLAAIFDWYGNIWLVRLYRLTNVPAHIIGKYTQVSSCYSNKWKHSVMDMVHNRHVLHRGRCLFTLGHGFISTRQCNMVVTRVCMKLQVGHVTVAAYVTITGINCCWLRQTAARKTGWRYFVGWCHSQ